jgi:hypothetical protein
MNVMNMNEFFVEQEHLMQLIKINVSLFNILINCVDRKIKRIGINKRDGIHPDTERDCHYYYQCIGQTKMREARCSGDQKFSSYTGRCGPAGNAPIPCGTFIPGSTATKSMIFFLCILNL